MKTTVKKRVKINSGSISALAARQWGPLTTRDVGAARQFKISMLHEMLLPRSSAPDVVHARTKELVYLIRGRITAFLDGSKFLFKKGDYFVIPAGTHHRFLTGAGGAEAFSIFLPPLGRRKFDAKIVFRRETGV